MKKIILTISFCQFFLLASFISISQTTGVGNSLNFDGTNDYVARSIFSTQQFNVTFEARIKLSGLAMPANKYILANGTGTTGFGLFLNTANQVNIRLGANNYTTSYTPPTNSFVLLSVVVTPNFVNFYANGVLTQTFLASMPPTPTGSFVIGSRDGTAEFFTGDLDEVRYWNRAVCQAEILHRVNCSATGLEPQLAALYKFNQGIAAGNNATVTTLNDNSPNMFNANLYNFALTGTSSNWINSSGAYGGNCSIAPLTLTISIAPSNMVCSGQSATLTASGGVGSYTWSTNQTTNPIVVTPTAIGMYSVIAQTGPACYGMALTAVSVVPLPTITVNSATICNGQTTVLTASGASSYTWNTGANTNSITVNPSVTTNYTVTGSNGLCADTKTTTVIVNSVTASITSSNGTSVCVNQSFTLNAIGSLVTYSWNTGANTPSISQNITAPGTYTYYVSGIASNSCTASASFTMNVLSCLGLSELSLHNLSIFPTPFNQFLKILSNEYLKINVFDITGKLVYKTEGNNIFINTGNWKNGVYVFEIEQNNTRVFKKLLKD